MSFLLLGGGVFTRGSWLLAGRGRVGTSFKYTASMCLRLILILTAVVFVAACDSEPQIESPPLKVLFDLSDPRAEFETKVRIREFRNYSLGFEFLLDDQNMAQRENIKHLLANSTEDSMSTQISIRLQITPIEPSSMEVTLAKEYFAQSLISWSDSSFNTEFVGLRLKPGVYRIALANQKQVDGFHKILTHFVLASNPKSTTVKN